MVDLTPGTKARAVAVRDLTKQKVAYAESKEHPQKSDSQKKVLQTILEEHANQRILRSKLSFDRNTYAIMYGNPYPPSHARLADLETINIEELQIGEHHRKRVLCLKTVGSPLESSALEAAVVDGSGTAERLAVYHLDVTSPRGSLLLDGTLLAIKEPYYTLTTGNSTLLRVDHPTDLVILDGTEALLPASLRIESTKRDAKSLNRDAKAAVKRNDHRAAKALYTRALEICTGADAECRTSILRNRALMSLNLGFLWQAFDDAQEVIELAEANAHGHVDGSGLSSALLLLGQAQCRLADYDGAKTTYKRVLNDSLDVSQSLGAEKGLEYAISRSIEQSAGKFNFHAILTQAAARDSDSMNCSSFLSNTETRKSGIVGNGLFATKALKMGDIVMCEKAFSLNQSRDAHFIVLKPSDTAPTDAFHPHVVARISEKLRQDPRMAERFFNLYSGRDDVPILGIVDGEVPVDTFVVDEIVNHNCFGFRLPRVDPKDVDGPVYDDVRGPPAQIGIWLHASRMNHACNANTTRKFLGDLMVLRATKDIAKDEEITVSYFDAGTVESVQQEVWWGFVCSCAVCVAHATAEGAHVDRKMALEKVDDFLKGRGHDTAAQFANDRDFKDALRLYANARKFYDKPVFAAPMPRLGLAKIGRWLQCAYGQRQAHEEVIRIGVEVLEDVGYQFLGTRSSDVATFLKVNAQASYHSIVAHEIAMSIAKAYRLTGGTQDGDYEAWKGFARTLYIIEFGHEVSFEADFSNF